MTNGHVVGKPDPNGKGVAIFPDGFVKVGYFKGSVYEAVGPQVEFWGDKNVVMSDN